MPMFSVTNANRLRLTQVFSNDFSSPPYCSGHTHAAWLARCSIRQPEDPESSEELNDLQYRTLLPLLPISTHHKYLFAMHASIYRARFEDSALLLAHAVLSPSRSIPLHITFHSLSSSSFPRFLSSVCPLFPGPGKKNCVFRKTA